MIDDKNNTSVNNDLSLTKNEKSNKFNESNISITVEKSKNDSKNKLNSKNLKDSIINSDFNLNKKLTNIKETMSSFSTDRKNKTKEKSDIIDNYKNKEQSVNKNELSKVLNKKISKESVDDFFSSKSSKYNSEERNKDKGDKKKYKITINKDDLKSVSNGENSVINNVLKYKYGVGSVGNSANSLRLESNNEIINKSKEEEISFKQDNLKERFIRNYNIESSSKLNYLISEGFDTHRSISDHYYNSSFKNIIIKSKNINFNNVRKKSNKSNSQIVTESTYKNIANDIIDYDNSLFHYNLHKIEINGTKHFFQFLKCKDEEKNIDKEREDLKSYILNLDKNKDKNILNVQNNCLFSLYKKRNNIIFEYCSNPTMDKILYFYKIKNPYWIKNPITIAVGNIIFKIIVGKRPRSVYNSDNNLSNEKKSNNSRNLENQVDIINKDEYLKQNKYSKYRSTSDSKNSLNYNANNTNGFSYDISIIKYYKNPSDNKLYKFNSLTKDVVKIGRSSKCEIKLEDPFTSKIHLQIKFDSDASKWYIIDGNEGEKSNLGTWIIIDKNIKIENDSEIKFHNYLLNISFS